MYKYTSYETSQNKASRHFTTRMIVHKGHDKDHTLETSISPCVSLAIFFPARCSEISSFKEENYLYISEKTLGSSTEQKTEVQSRLGLLPWFREGDLRKGAQCSPRYGGISLTCCLFSFQPIPLDSLVPLLGQLVLPFWPRNLHPFLYLGQNIIHLMVEFNQWYVHLCDYSSLPSTQSSVSSLLFIASIGRTFHLPHFAHFLLPHLQLWRLSWYSCLSWRILLSTCHSLLFSS